MTLNEHASADSQAAMLDDVLVDFTSHLKKALGNHLCELWLYGSRARGEARPDSDDDLLVVVDRDADALRDRVLTAQPLWPQAPRKTRHGAQRADLAEPGLCFVTAVPSLSIC